VRRQALTLACVAVLAPLAVAAGSEPPAVVVVRVFSATGEAQRATGTIIADGRVLTVDHVLDGAERVEVLGASATVAERRPDLDLALLRVPGASGPPVRFADAPAGLRILVQREGAVQVRQASLRRRVLARLVDQPGRPRRPSLELSATVSAGDSGAPVLTRDGELVGVVYAHSTRREGTAYAVRAGELSRLAR
jgi:S1-C subfamily serine protease